MYRSYTTCYMFVYDKYYSLKCQLGVSLIVFVMISFPKSVYYQITWTLQRSDTRLGWLHLQSYQITLLPVYTSICRLVINRWL